MNDINKKSLRESHIRSILKGISWRVIATLTTIVIAWFITGEASYAIKIGGIEVFTKILLYYLHERIWQIVPRGTVRNIFRKV